MKSIGDILSGLGITPENAAATSHELRRAKAARFAGLCRDGFCRYAVKAGEHPKPNTGDICDGWLGVDRIEDSGPILRFRPCDRALAWNAARRAAVQETKGRR